MPGNYLNPCHPEQVRAIPQSGQARQNKTVVISRHVRLGRTCGETLRFLAGSVRAFPLLCPRPVNCESYLKNSRHLETYPAWPDMRRDLAVFFLDLSRHSRHSPRALNRYSLNETSLCFCR